MSRADGPVVVVGASLAGLRATEAARDEGFDGDLVLVGDEAHLPYDRPPLSKEMLAPGELTTAHLFPDVEEQLHNKLGVQVLTGHRALALDLGARTVTVRPNADPAAEREVAFGSLLIATGVRARSLAGSEHLNGVHRLRTLDDALAIRAALEGGARTVVIGAGFIGSEVASAARRRDLPVTLVEAAPAPLVRAVGATAGLRLAALHERNGSQLICGRAVESLVGDKQVEAVRLDDGTELPADLVVVGIGADPVVDWLADSGLTLDGGVVCDPTLRASDGVYAAGDVALWHNPLFDRPMRLEHWTNAGDQAAHAMANLLAPERATPYDDVPYFWSDWYGQRIQFAGLAVGEPEVVIGTWDDASFVALYREDDRLVGALALDRRSDIMKFRAQIARRSSWTDALDLAARRNATTSVPA